MKNVEIRELTAKELIERIDTEKANLVRMNMNHTVSPLDRPHQILHTRRLVAQLKTELRKRQLNENKKSE
ncbi:MAG: 50S ribosomal protein L29 [Bacteroidales bacterium]|jgi:large subunit ribosomal protein L29|nr:50S ribosomal protein L29 [Bacteroidales bacterium]MDD2570845.1 50S ribosomal protein L29 [Bacteroidales bacterium]MDD2812165.1 50S ribosomal protein L29 [Bacteroidales bacterium]MDD3384431.1 50S ribosomal protein L29 [Bacteroidales bacterium]MDD3810927.1 50S ribosomal protein L29 [Bacteroidales bacterium]